MYVELRTSDTLHKKPCRIGPGLCGTSENSLNANFGELRKVEIQLPRMPLPRTPVNKGKR